MPITVRSACGRSFPLKDELAGKLVTCPDCGENLRVPGGTEAPAPSRFPGLDPAFSRKKFLLRQKHMAISEKYYVWDEAGKTVMFVQRPAHFLKGLVAALGGLATLIGVIVAFVALGALVGKEAGGAVIVAGFFVAIAAMIVVIILLAPKRHVFFYRDDTAKELLLKVDQDQKFAPIVATYTVRDPAGTILAVLRKNYLYNIIRKRWYVLSPAGAILSVIKEDSIICRSSAASWAPPWACSAPTSSSSRASRTIRSASSTASSPFWTGTSSTSRTTSTATWIPGSPSRRA